MSIDNSPHTEIVVQTDEDKLEKPRFTPQQEHAIDLLAWPYDEITRKMLTTEDIASRVGICSTTIYKWRRTPEFAEAIYKKTMAFLASMSPLVMAPQLKKAIEQGDTNAARLIDEVCHRALENAGRGGTLNVSGGKNVIILSWKDGQELGRMSRSQVVDMSNENDNKKS